MGLRLAAVRLSPSPAPGTQSLPNDYEEEKQPKLSRQVSLGGRGMAPDKPAQRLTAGGLDLRRRSMWSKKRF
ncbi:hypothetical protein TTX_0343 [Thermoproteus tenax Kra 1]|uniref:Uncharacterized protein n=1 Tax=Thermoproteus tenax (strain ATCC 35583 / DSM 2078 / JCM 9277 / NBRC 100435 / Kra 1) TaxID=768679 RepID=G4RN74_THETK|nr:hypothetical protein TTX_0343 [Thermoproteus tenax Kra 1]